MRTASRLIGLYALFIFTSQVARAFCFNLHIRGPPSGLPLSRRPCSQQGSGQNEEELLQEVSTEFLAELCRQYGLECGGSKINLLGRLRRFGQDQAQKEQDRLERRRKRIEEGDHDERETFETLGDEEDPDEEAFFYYAASSLVGGPSELEHQDKASPNAVDSKQKGKQAISAYVDENGNKIETVFSSTDENDLTSIAASQPGQASESFPLSFATSSNANSWDQNHPSTTKKATSERDYNFAREEVIELFENLLSLTGLKGFQQDASSGSSSSDFVGFDPTFVDSDALSKTSRSLRMKGGELLSSVARDFELRGVGYDGLSGDDVAKGGGHYKEACKVRSFLEGYRQAEVRRLARETITLLLNRVFADGLQGLDLTLATMGRNGAEFENEAGELNDSLLIYLDDTIRQQEKKVERCLDNSETIARLEANFEDENFEDAADGVNDLWSVSYVDGEKTETFDPNDPANAKALEQEIERTRSEVRKRRPSPPTSSSEQLLLLLKLLRDRLKVEALFSSDEKSRNLRVLGYCLELETEAEREELIRLELGRSIERVDSFSELLHSAIEYSESTSHQLFPAKVGSLDTATLKNILAVVGKIRETYALQ